MGSRGSYFIKCKNWGKVLASDEGKDKNKNQQQKNCGQELALANHESLIFTWNNPVVHASPSTNSTNECFSDIVYLSTISMVTLKVR